MVAIYIRQGVPTATGCWPAQLTVAIAPWYPIYGVRLLQPNRGISCERSASAAYRVRLVLLVWIDASAEVVAELEGRSAKGDSACERV